MPINNNDNQYLNDSTKNQDVTYYVNKSPKTIEVKNTLGTILHDRLTFYNNGMDSRSRVDFNNGRKKYYSADGTAEIIESSGQVEIVLFLGGDAYTAPAVLHKNNSNQERLLYLHRDYLGSIVAITNQTGGIEERRHFDAWGQLTHYRRGNTTTLPNGKTTFLLLDRGYTSHEHLLSVGLVHMNGRLYDPVLHRFLQPDNYVQDPMNSQNYNRYGYCWNNPLKFSDPSGEWVFVLIGAIVGAYMGGTIANNGEFNPTKWDYSGKTWTYIISGAIVGAISGGISNSIATSGIAYANTLSLVGGSLVNSIGTFMYTKGETGININIGIASFDFKNLNFGYLGEKGNSFLENFGYVLGALANLSDVLAGRNPKAVELRTENDPNYSKENDALGNPIIRKDVISHSQIVDGKKVFIDWGPTTTPSGLFDTVGGTNDYTKGLIPSTKMQSNPITISGVNADRIAKFGNYLSKNGGKYNLVFNNCVTQTSRALNMSGAFNIGIHPYFLQAQMYLRSIGVRPMLFSYQLTNK